MDRGVPTEKILTEMRQSDPPVYYLVGTPKGRLSKLSQELLAVTWQSVRSGVEVKLLAQEQELYVLAKSIDRVNKERSMRQRQLRALLKRLKELHGMKFNKSQALLLKLGVAKGNIGRPGGCSTSFCLKPKNAALKSLSPSGSIGKSSEKCVGARAAIYYAPI
jgi:hypothetical protein